MAYLQIGKCGEASVNIQEDEFFLTRALITANSGGGKSWLTRRIIELFAPRVQVIVIDPEGEFSTLRKKFNFALIGEGGEAAADIRSAGLLAERLLEHKISAICDIFNLKAHQRGPWVKAFLDGLMNAPKNLWHRVIIVIDEAQLFAPENGKSEAFQAVVDLCTRGRKRGFCPILVTQRLATLSKQATSQLLNRLVGPTFEDVDLDRAVDVLSVARADQAEFRKKAKLLEPGNFYALGRAISKEMVLFRVGSVQTPHPEIGGSAGNAPSLPASRLRELLPKLGDLPKEAETKAKTESELRQDVSRLTRELAQARAARPAAAPAAAPKVSVLVKDKIVRVPALKPGDVNRLEKLVGRMEKGKDHLGFISQNLDMACRSIQAAIIDLDDRNRVTPIKGAPPAAAAPKTLTPPKSPPARALINVNPRPASDPTKYVEGEPEALLKGERKMLQVLAQFNPGTRTPGQLAHLSGYAMSGGTYRTYTSKLFRLGYMRKGMLGELSVTDEGLAALGGDIPDAPKNTDELLDMWRGKLLAGERKILDILVEAYDTPMAKAELAEKSGFDQNGGTFRTYLSTLRRNQLAVVTKETVVASESLFQLQSA